MGVVLFNPENMYSYSSGIVISETTSLSKLPVDMCVCTHTANLFLYSTTSLLSKKIGLFDTQLSA